MSSIARGTEIRDPWKHRVDSGDWEAITAEVGSSVAPLLPEWLTRRSGADPRLYP